MDPLVADFLQMVRAKSPCHSITENEILTERVCLTVFPCVSAPTAQRLTLAFPLQCTDEETELCRALKILLVGCGELPALLARSRNALRFSSRHEETLGRWKLQYHVSGTRKTLKAERLPKIREDQPGSTVGLIS